MRWIVTECVPGLLHYERSEEVHAPWGHLLRVAAPGRELDGKSLSETGDIFCYGRTREEACDEVLSRYAAREQECQEALSLSPNTPAANTLAA